MRQRRIWSVLLLAVGTLAMGLPAGRWIDRPVEAAPVSAPTQFDLVGGPESDRFGSGAAVLANGNYVVTDSWWDSATAVDVGAVYLYDGATDKLISTLTGSTELDRVGGHGITPLATGNFVVSSPRWDNGPLTDVGAVTFVNGTTGLSGVVSTNNSLHGTSAGDEVGVDERGFGEFGGVGALANGNYVVANQWWKFGLMTNAGAVTFGDGLVGVSGPVTSQNSLHGTSANDRVGSSIRELSNGNYLVASAAWDFGDVEDAGAVTFGDGVTGVSGPVSTKNSLHGTSRLDVVGGNLGGGVVALANGNYVVASTLWDNGPLANVGAVTFGDGRFGVSGPVTTANSLHGSSAGDGLASPSSGVTALVNGNYVVSSPGWDNGSVANAGAVTFGDGVTGLTGPVTTSNSLHGAESGVRVGTRKVVALSNGNYVVDNPWWDHGGLSDIGAVTFGNGRSGTFGPVTTANSLYGTTASDRVGIEVVALANGNYVVGTDRWDNGSVADVGAVVLGNGTTGTSGPVTTGNSLHGTQNGDGVGHEITALVNGNYVVGSPRWDFGSVVDAGAATFGSGTTGITGAVTTDNSLHGTATNDQVGLREVVALANGNYVVRSPGWDGPAVDAGAVTFGDGVTGVSGPVTTDNSLHGTVARDGVGRELLIPLPNGNYVVRNPSWDLGSIGDAGAVVFGDGDTGVSGPITAENSLHGTSPQDQVGRYVTILSSGTYAVTSPLWDNGSIVDAGAVTLGDGDRGLSGAVTTANSAVGTPPGQALQPWYSGRLISLGNPPAPTTARGVLPVPTTQNRVLMIDDSAVGPNAVPCFSVAGTPGDAAIVNLTPVSARGGGFGLMVTSDVVTVPAASNVNYSVGTVDPNVAVAPLGADQEVCYVNSIQTSVHLVADHLGTIDAVAYTPATASGAPVRRVDTRISLGGATVSPSARSCFSVAGSPGDVAIVNLTPVRADGWGFGQLISSDVDTPPAGSNVNFAPGTIDPNVALAPIGADGEVCFANSDLSSVDLVADHLGTIAAEVYAPATSSGALERRVDTRIGLGGAMVGPSERLCFDVTGSPGDLAWVNLTPVRADGWGFGQLVSSDVVSPSMVSNVNYGPGSIDPNLAAAVIGSDGKVCFVNSDLASVHLVADHLGTLASSSYTPATPSGVAARIVDTRIP